jgi:hypothetical protein
MAPARDTRHILPNRPAARTGPSRGIDGGTEVSIHAMPTHRLVAAAALVLAALAATSADATSLRKQNLTQLITESQSIISGKVDRVTDGVDENGMPYTEITIIVSNAAKGNVSSGSRHKFRQFGLLKPRKMPNGKVMLALSPEGFPKWGEGERVVAFLHKPASRTGFQTTAGLAQGKLRMLDGRVSNQFNNEGLFDGVQVQQGLLSEKERTMLSSKGPVDAATLVGLIGRAVTESWIENGEMR